MKGKRLSDFWCWIELTNSSALTSLKFEYRRKSLPERCYRSCQNFCWITSLLKSTCHYPKPKMLCKVIIRSVLKLPKHHLKGVSNLDTFFLRYRERIRQESFNSISSWFEIQSDGLNSISNCFNCFENMESIDPWASFPCFIGCNGHFQVHETESCKLRSLSLS